MELVLVALAVYLLATHEGPTAPANSNTVGGAPSGPKPPMVHAGGAIFGAGGAIDQFDQLEARGVTSFINSKIPLPASVKPIVTAGAKTYFDYLTPVGQVGQAPKLINATARVTGAADRYLTAGFGRLPTALKVAAAPVYYPTKVTTTLVKGTAALANKTVGALESGAKSAGHAVASGVSKVLGFL